MSEEIYGHEFDEAEKDFYKLEEMSFQTPEYQDLVIKLLNKFVDVFQKVDNDGVFSENEDLSDMKDLDVKYILIPYYLGELFAKKRFERDQVSDRFQYIKQKESQLKYFIKLCRQYGFLKKDEKPIPQNVNPFHRREMKINLSRTKRQAEKDFEEIKDRKGDKVERLQKGGSSDDYGVFERKYFSLRIRFLALDTIDSFPYLEEELKIIEFQMRMTPEQAKKLEQERNRPQNPKEGQFFRIGPGGKITNFDMKKKEEEEEEEEGGPMVQDQYKQMLKNQKQEIFFREKVKKDLFKKRNEPTVFLDQVAALEMRNMKEREEKDRKAEEKRKKEEYDEDNFDHVNAKMYKDREWTAWKEDNPKGTGNMQSNKY